MNGEFYSIGKFARFQLARDEIKDSLQTTVYSAVGYPSGGKQEKADAVSRDLFARFFDPENAKPKQESGRFASLFSSWIEDDLELGAASTVTKYNIDASLKATRAVFGSVWSRLNIVADKMDESLGDDKSVDQEDFDDAFVEATEGTEKDVFGAVCRLSKIVEEETEKKKLISVARAAGLLGGSVKNTVDPELSKLLDKEEIRDLLNELGKLVSDTGRAKGTDRQGHLDVVGVTLGSNATRLLPCEIARFDDGPLEDDLLRRLSSENALNWQMQNENEAGDFVLLVDNSGSMVSGGKHLKAKAFALFAAGKMISENRTLIVTLFSGWGTKYPIVEVRTKDDLADLFDLLGHYPSGGTVIDDVMANAFARVSKQEGIDLVVISDGMVDANTETVDLARAVADRFHWLQIGARFMNPLSEIATVFNVDDAMAGRGIAELAKTL